MSVRKNEKSSLNMTLIPPWPKVAKERSDEPSYLVNIDPATASRGGGGGWWHESAGVAERASEAGRYDASGEHGPRRSSRRLALVGPRGRGRYRREREGHRRTRGGSESTENTNDGIRSHEQTCPFSLVITLPRICLNSRTHWFYHSRGIPRILSFHRGTITARSL